MRQKFGAILSELKHHAPFTSIGAATGVICMLLFKHAGPEVNHRLFQVFHPGHVVLSAIVTASLFKLYDKKASLLKIVVIGYLGAIGVATVSDCVLPFFGETILGVAVPTHGALHEHEGAHEHNAEAPIDTHTPYVELDEHDHEAESHEAHAAEDEPEAETESLRDRLHLGFIEDWYLVNPAALLGIIIAWFWPRTKFPHAGHVLISTWASSFHVLMNTHRELTPTMFVGVFVVLFIAVWLPCCISDIVFPLLFVESAPLCTHHPHHAEVPS
ncbi:MAG: hypothetical protein JSW27_15105 [Phycisphaerales bacterium]|nr:MAG: hypothetical protein JSW27_15105 [Phycisphaerales bacterium]